MRTVTSHASPTAIRWGCGAAIAAFVAPFAVAFVGLPPALVAYIRWRGDYGANQSPEALAILTMIVIGPILFFVCAIVACVVGVIAFNVVASSAGRRRQSTRS